jgi:PAS domain S-box-containing protein
MNAEAVTWEKAEAARVASAMARVTALLSRDLSPQAVGEAILQQMLEAFGVRMAFLGTVSEERREILCLAQSGADRKRPSLVTPLLSFDDPYLISLAVRTRRTQVIQSPDEIPAGLGGTLEYASKLQLGAMIAVPLIAYDRLVGALACALPGGRRFTPEALEALHAIAQIGAVTLDNSHRLASERRLREQVEAVRHASLTIDRLKDLGSALQATVDNARELVGARYGMLRLLGGGPEVEDIWCSSGLTAEQAHIIQEALEKCDSGPFVFDDFRPWRVRDAESDPCYSAFPWSQIELQNSCLLGVPTFQEDRPTARLYLIEKEGAPEFTPEDAYAAEMLMRHAVRTYDQVRAREALERELERRLRAEASLAQAQEIARLGTYTWDLQNDRIELSEVARHVLGVANGEAPLSFEGVLRRIHPDDRDRLTKETMTSLTTGRPAAPGEYRVVWPDGTVRVLYLTGNFVLEDGVPVRNSGTILDITERKRVETQLREREEWLSLIFDLAPIAMAIEGLDARFVRVNNAMCDLLGYTRSELLERTFQDISVSEDVPAGAAGLADLLSGKVPRFTLTKRYLRKNGSIVDATLYLSLVRDAEGRPQNFIAQIEDITERKRSEAALQRSEQQLRALIDLAPEGILINQDGKVALANRAIAAMLGYPSVNDLLGTPIPKIVREEDRELVSLRVKRTLEWGEPVPPAEIQLRRRDGSLVPTETVGIRIEFEGRPGTLVLLREISERKRAEADREHLISMLAAERRWLETVIDRTPVGIVLIEATEGGHFHMNQVARDILGGGDRVQRDFVRFKHPVCDTNGRELEPYEKITARTLRGETIVGEEFLVAHVSGARIPIRVNAGALRDEHGRVSGAIIVVEDITPIKEQARLREEWMSVIAHDLRQPVTVIIAYAHLLAHSLEDPRLKVKLDHINRSARQLQRLISDLLDMSRIEARQLSLHPSRIRVEEALRAAAERAMAAAAEHPIHVEIDVGVESIWADPERLDQILSNLLSNAAKYSYPHSAIRVHAVRQNRFVEIRVMNTGEGLPPDELRRLFTRFHRANRALESRVSGVGLGLYITHGLVEAHGGRIWAESEPDAITTFSFTVPIAPEVTGFTRALGK